MLLSHVRWKRKKVQIIVVFPPLGIWNYTADNLCYGRLEVPSRPFVFSSFNESKFPLLCGFLRGVPSTARNSWTNKILENAVDTREVLQTSDTRLCRWIGSTRPSTPAPWLRAMSLSSPPSLPSVLYRGFEELKKLLTNSWHRHIHRACLHAPRPHCAVRNGWIRGREVKPKGLQQMGGGDLQWSTPGYPRNSQNSRVE